MIRVVICDGDGTLGLPNPTRPIKDLLSTIDRLEITLAVATNGTQSQVRRRFRDAGLKAPAIIVTPRVAGSRKPSPLFVERIRSLTGVERQEIAYLGDDDRTDIFCAINSGVLPYAAHYSLRASNLQYGFPIYDPKAFGDFLQTFGMQATPYFGWVFKGKCGDTGKKIDVRALIGQHEGLSDLLVRVLKDQEPVQIGSNNVPLASVLFHYLVTQCYMSGLTQSIDLIAVYPGSQQGIQNELLTAFSELMARAFKDKFAPDLLVRHTTAPRSRYRGNRRNIYDQFRTIQVNPDYENTCRDKTILVLDDFTTTGYSLECARRLLIAAGAESVTGLAIAKWRNTHAVTSIGKSWDPLQPTSLVEEDILVTNLAGSSNYEADEYFHEEILPVYQR